MMVTRSCMNVLKMEVCESTESLHLQEKKKFIKETKQKKTATVLSHTNFPHVNKQDTNLFCYKNVQLLNYI